MKTTYRRASIDERRKVLILAGVIGVGIFVLCLPSVRGVISRVVYSTAPSLWEAGNNVGNFWNSFLGEFHSKRTLFLENETLKEQVSRMEAQILDRNLLAEQVLELEDSLGRNPEDVRVLARVLAGPGVALYDTLSVDVGSSLGVAVGDLVVYSGSGVVGVVAEVYPQSSKIKLQSSPGEKTPVLLGEDSIPVVATGRGMGNFEVLVPEESNLSVGDIVTLPPGGFVLGIISAIESKPSEPLVRVLFRTSFNISNIRSVEILVNSQVY